jgi:hypothetical protein
MWAADGGCCEWSATCNDLLLVTYCDGTCSPIDVGM